MAFLRTIDKPRIRELYDEVLSIKADLGDELVILAHHYQRPEIVEVGDFRGDSFQLSQMASDQQKARYIAFCGVHFMAESARIVARPEQRVFHPNLNSGCPMADMATGPAVGRALDELTAILPEKETVVPVVYMNTDAATKGICGQEGGLVCTSSNAKKAFEWAFQQGERILFVPDEHLGRNTSHTMGIPDDEMLLYDPNQVNGGHSPEALRKAKVYLWKGYCHVHTWYTPEHIEQARQTYPGCRVVVHPECCSNVVEAADAVGSTAFIVKYVESSSPGDTIVIGTEVNLTNRLAYEYPDRTVVPLSRSLCPNMFRISIEKLRDTLRAMPTMNEIIVPDETIHGARLAMERMLALP
ncbi:MAG: quinolinate synthase [Myxococcales bacterium]|nr:quinolinate synthase [Myxococcales bacterium]